MQPDFSLVDPRGEPMAGVELEGFDPEQLPLPGIAPGTNVHLLTADGRHLVPQANATVVAKRGKTPFTVCVSNGRVAFQSPQGRYLGAQANGTVRASSLAMGPNEEFEASRIGTGDGYTLRAKHKQYLSAQPNGTTKASSPAVTEAETFSILPEGAPGLDAGDSDIQAAQDPFVVPSGTVAGLGSRLITVPAVGTAFPPRVVRPVATAPSMAPRLATVLRAPPKIAAPPQADVDVGDYDAVAGVLTDARVVIPLQPGDRADAAATLQVDPDVARLVFASVIGAHMIVNLTIDWRMSGEWPFRIAVVAQGGRTKFAARGNIRVKHAKPAPFGLCSIVGSSNSAEVPYIGQLWKDAQYRAYLEPPLKEFRLTGYKGTMKAGAKIFPFKVCFLPRDPRSLVVLLVVVFNEQDEYTVEITGAVGGFQGRSWGRRHHGTLKKSGSKVEASEEVVE